MITRNIVELNASQIQKAAPSIFAEHASSHLTARYCLFKTNEVVEGLRQAGWAPVRAQEQRVRLETRKGFQKHMVKFQRRDIMNNPLVLGDSNMELILTNSHDGTSAYKLQVGVFRLVCSNGMVVNSKGFDAFSVRHNQRAVNDIVSAGETLLSASDSLSDKLNSFRVRILTDSERKEFARQALEVRYESEDNAPVRPEMLLRLRRMADEGNSLWNTFNVVQENLMRGTSPDHRLSLIRRAKAASVRKVSGIEAELQLNRSLWQRAETFLLN